MFGMMSKTLLTSLTIPINILFRHVYQRRLVTGEDVPYVQLKMSFLASQKRRFLLVGHKFVARLSGDLIARVNWLFDVIVRVSIVA